MAIGGPPMEHPLPPVAIANFWKNSLDLRSQRISALITSGSEIIIADQRCFRSDPALYITCDSLNSGDSALISAEKSIFQSSKIIAEERCLSSDFFWNSSLLNNAYFSWILDDIFSSIFIFFWNLSKHFSKLRHRILIFCPNGEKKGSTKFSCSIFWQGKNII